MTTEAKVKFVDKRGGYSNGDGEVERLAARREIQEKIVSLQLIMQRVRILRDELAELDRQADAAANVHGEATRPVQARLAEVEQQMAEAMLNREAVSPKLEAERAGLLKALADANAVLQEATGEIAGTRRELQKQVRESTTAAAGLPMLKNKLADPGIADPKLLLQLFCAKQATRWAGERLRAAQAQLGQWQREIAKMSSRDDETIGINTFGHCVKRKPAATTKNYRVYSARVERWEAEVASATAALSAARAANDAIYKKIIDE